MKLAYFDCFAGVAGDMIVGALLDAGCDFAALEAELAKLALPGVSVAAEKVARGGLIGTKFEVKVGRREGRHRPLNEILSLIASAGLPGHSAERAQAVFARLGEAEAKVHGVDVQEVHFHEVGAADSITDIVGAAVALELMGIGRIVCSPIPTGSGTVATAHGTLPVPAPATAELLTGARTAGGPPEFTCEVTTPTGAAVMVALAESFAAAPAMYLEAIGYGAGSRDDLPVPNLLRVMVGAPADDGDADTVVELSANLDDCSGEVIGAAVERLMSAGCLDAWASPIYMKKSRPAWMLSALCDPSDAHRAEEIIFAETTTLGVRRRICRRSKLSRRHVTVETAYGPVRVKVSTSGGRELTASPEFADARAAAEAHGVPVREVIAAAATEYRSRTK